MLYSKQAAYFNKTKMEGFITVIQQMTNDLTDLNINERIAKFKNQLKS